MQRLVIGHLYNVYKLFNREFEMSYIITCLVEDHALICYNKYKNK